MLQRSAAYLPPTLVRNAGPPPCKRVGWFAAFRAWITGAHLTLGDEREGSRQQVLDENINLGVISALFATMVLPMAFENVADLVSPEEEADFLQSGFVKAFDIEAGEVGRIKSDITHFSFWLSSLAILTSLVICVTNLLGVNELGNDDRVYLFLSRMGFWARAPYVTLLLGVTFALPGIGLRWAISSFGFEVMLVELFVVLCLAGNLFYVHIRIVQNMFGVIHDSAMFAPVVLELSALKEDLKLYMENEADPSFNSFLAALACVTKEGCIVPLSSHTRLRAKIAYLSDMSVRFGVQVSDEEITRRVLFGAGEEPGSLELQCVV